MSRSEFSCQEQLGQEIRIQIEWSTIFCFQFARSEFLVSMTIWTSTSNHKVIYFWLPTTNYVQTVQTIIMTKLKADLPRQNANIYIFTHPFGETNINVLHQYFIRNITFDSDYSKITECFITECHILQFMVDVSCQFPRDVIIDNCKNCQYCCCKHLSFSVVKTRWNYIWNHMGNLAKILLSTCVQR